MIQITVTSEMIDVSSEREKKIGQTTVVSHEGQVKWKILQSSLWLVMLCMFTWCLFYIHVY